MKIRYALVLLALLGCEKNQNPSSATADVPPTRAAAATDVPPSAADLTVPELPSSTLVAIRGSNLRKVLNFIAPGVRANSVLAQVTPNITPGVGEHGGDIDPDAPFAAILSPDPAAAGRINISVAWPLRPGMELAENARTGHGFHPPVDGLYEPTGTAQDVLLAGADGGVPTPPCWVARRANAGWAMLCGPTAQMRTLSRWLVRAASSPPPEGALLDVQLRPEPVRQVLTMQLAQLEAQDPRRNDAGTNRSLVAQYEAVRHSAEITKQLFDDLSQAHASLSLDETTYRLRAQVEFANASGAGTRALVGSSVGQHAALDLLRRLPATATSYFATGFDVSSLAPLLSDEGPDPRVAAAFGPEMVRFQEALRDLTGFRRHGQRAMGFIPGEGMTRVEIVRLPGALAEVTRLHATATAVPRAPRPSGANPADQFAVLPTPAGVPAGTIRLRLGPDPAHLPPQVPADVRAQYQRTVLLVPEGDTLTIVDALDPVARYHAMLTGDRLAPTVPDDRAAIVHLTPAAVLSWIGAPAPEANATDAIHGTLQATRVGDAGARFEVNVESSTLAVNNLRDQINALQAQQAQMMRQMQQAQQQAIAAQRRAMQPGGGRMPSAAQLPDPNFQLQPPR